MDRGDKLFFQSTIMKSQFVLLLAAMFVSLHGEVPALRSSVVSRPQAACPGCYWNWINDNFSKEGITKDLEAMDRVGIGRAYIGQICGQGDRRETPVGKRL